MSASVLCTTTAPDPRAAAGVEGPAYVAAPTAPADE